jgi:hypothetical protein
MTTSKETLEAIIKAQRYQAGAWQKVVDCARQYAMMKATGSYMENGSRHRINFSDKASMEKMFADTLLRAAEDAFVEDALVGGVLQSAE